MDFCIWGHMALQLSLYIPTPGTFKVCYYKLIVLFNVAQNYESVTVYCHVMLNYLTKCCNFKIKRRVPGAEIDQKII